MEKEIFDHEETARNPLKSEKLERILMSFVLCNNLRKKMTENEDFLYEGSSPDEIALGNFAREMEFVIESRNEKKITIENHKSGFENF